MIHDHAVERAVLGSFLVNSGAFDEIADEGITGEDFSLDSHRRIFCAAQAIVASAADLDIVSLTHALAGSKQLESIGGAAYVSSLVDGVPDRGSVVHHAQILRELSRRRRLMAACNVSVTRLEDSSDFASESNELAARIAELSSDCDDPQADGVMRCTDAALKAWQQENRRTTDLIGLPTGVKRLDRLTVGIRRGEFWIFGARPGAGKSSYACQMVRANCEVGNLTHLFSLEMSKTEILQRLWAAVSGVPFHQIHNGRCDASVEASVRAAACEVSRWPLLISDKTLSVERITARARAAIRRYKTSLVVVDFLQNIPHNERDPRLGINHVSAGLRELARATGVPVVAFSQLRRGNDPEAKPSMFDLRESGQLEQDAHLVGLLHRPVDDHGEPTGEDVLSVQKNRHGRTGDLPVRFNPASMAFDEREM
jgi:replicative DNA helicase